MATSEIFLEIEPQIYGRKIMLGFKKNFAKYSKKKKKQKNRFKFYE